MILESDWDYQPKIGKDSGHHITRESEHRILLDFISRRNEGSMLVCGQRGAGKTSAVFKATNETIIKNEKIKPILIKATSIHLKSKEDSKSEGDSKDDILRGIIRSLYNQIQEDSDIVGKLKIQTSKLYNKAIASEVKQVNQIRSKSIHEKTSRIRINLICALSLVAVGILSLSDIILEYNWILFIIIITNGLYWTWNYSIIIKKSSINTASNYYRYDYDFSIMQSEFELLLEEFVKEKFKILFIMDELDKVEEESLSIILNLKMLINQGNALFIFIASPKILSNIEDKANPNSTLFSQTLYLKRPLFDEMRYFITEIILNGSELTQNTDYKNFQNFLCYQSKTSFFALYNVIRDTMIKILPEGPVLNSNLNTEQITKANLQKSIEWVYEREKYDTPSLWAENDDILETLYNVCNNLENTPKLKDIVFDEQGLKFSENNSTTLTKPKSRSAVIGLFTFLVSQGYLQKTQENTYRIIGHLDTIIEEKGGVFAVDEQRFKEEYENMLELAINMANIHNKHIEDLGEIFSSDTINSKWSTFSTCLNNYFNITAFEEHHEIYIDLLGIDSAVYPSEKLQPMTSELQNAHVEIKHKFVDLLAAVFVKKIQGLEIHQAAKDINQSVLSSYRVPNTPFVYNELIFDKYSKSHKLQYVVITENIPIDHLKELLDENDRNVLIISLGDSEDNLKYQDISSALSIRTLQQCLDELYTLNNDTKKYLFMTITIPLKSDDLKQILNVL